jgi:hypothetical protein
MDFGRKCDSCFRDNSSVITLFQQQITFSRYGTMWAAKG